MTGKGAREPIVRRVAAVLIWLWRLVKGWLPQTLGVGATVFSIIWGAYGEKIWTDGAWAFWAGLLLLGLAIAAQIFVQRPSYMELSKRTEQAEAQSEKKSEALEQALTVLLRNLAEHCAIDANSDRASVYYFHDERFVMLARWSTHPVYTRPGRREYPTGQGAIGDAWDRGSVVTKLPASRKRWEQRLVKTHGFTESSTRGLAMQCQSIAALRVQTAHHAVGVLVFESTDSERATQATLDTMKDSKLYATLSELVGAVATLTLQVEQLEHAVERATTASPDWKSVPMA